MFIHMNPIIKTAIRKHNKQEKFQEDKNNFKTHKQRNLREKVSKRMMWDSPMYAVNMFYCYFLIKNLLWPVAG